MKIGKWDTIGGMRKQINLKKKRRPKKRMSAKRPSPPTNEEPKEKRNRRGLLRIADEDVNEMILTMCREAGVESGVRPEAIAQAIYPEQWQTMLKRIKLMAKQMAKRDELLILRKGKPVDPEDAKGIIKYRITELGMRVGEESDEEE